MRFLHPEHDELLELALEDVFLLPGRFDRTSRLETDLTPVDFAGGSHPVVSANMNAVTGKRMAETMARFGGLGVLPQDMSLDTVERIVGHIKAADPRYDTALSVSPDATLHDVEGIMRKRAHGMVVVVDDARRPVGILTPADLRDRDQYSPVDKLMQTELVTVQVGTPNRDAFLSMERERVKAVPVLDDDGTLHGVLTKDDAVRLELLTPSLDAGGRLMVAAAVGISSEARDKAARLLELGVDVAGARHRARPSAADAGGHRARCARRGERSRAARGRQRLHGRRHPRADRSGRRRDEGQRRSGRDVHDPHADGRRAGRPSARCAPARRKRGGWASTSGPTVACGTRATWRSTPRRAPRGSWSAPLLAGTFESPGDVKTDAEGNIYKQNYGMASARAVAERTADLDAFERAKKGFFREGISTSRIYIRPGRESVGALLIEMITGLQSALTYVGAATLDEHHEKAVVGVQTLSGYAEGTPHGIEVR